MQINASSVNSINFLEQKKSNTSTSNTSQEKLQNYEDEFVGKTLSKNTFFESNDTIATLQVAYDSIINLKNNNTELQQLSERVQYFKSEEMELNERFEQTTENMLDIVDNTVFQDTQIFYSALNFTSGSYEFNLSLSENFNIEDFTLGDSESLKTFESNLKTLEEDILKVKNHFEVANFNNLASLHVEVPNLEESSQDNIILAKQSLGEAHDNELLRSKVLDLLKD